MSTEMTRSLTWQFWDAAVGGSMRRTPGWRSASDEADARERAGLMGHAFIREVASVTVETINYPADQTLGAVHCNAETYDHLGPWDERYGLDVCRACGEEIGK